jgi:hypothetical protein
MGNKALRNRQKNALPTELALAVECCRWVNEPARANAIAEAASIADWPVFLATVERHRVAGLAWNALHSLDIDVPEAIQSELSARANAIAAHGLQSAVQSAALSAAFDRAEISHLFVKGLPVGALAYSAPFLKHSWDIDLLVEGNRIEEAAALLDELGFDISFPDIGSDWSRLARWHRVQKDSAWRHRETGLMVELHGRLADNPLLISTVGISSPQQQVWIAQGISLPTLAWPELFAHLCVHGASSAWFRLKWISDLAALLVRSGSDLEELYERSQQLGAGRAAAQALLLAHRLFDIPIGGKLFEMLNSNAANRWLADAALDQLLSSEPGNRLFGTGLIHLSQFLLLPDFRFKAIEARRQIAAARSNLFG